MIKLLYLLVGITLKQTIDEVKSLVDDYVKYLARYRAELQTYRGVPAHEKGSPEAYHAVREHEHRQAVEPEVVDVTKRIRRVRYIPLAVYALATLVLIGVIVWLEQPGGES